MFAFHTLRFILPASFGCSVNTICLSFFVVQRLLIVVWILLDQDEFSKHIFIFGLRSFILLESEFMRWLNAYFNHCVFSVFLSTLKHEIQYRNDSIIAVFDQIEDSIQNIVIDRSLFFLFLCALCRFKMHAVALTHKCEQRKLLFGWQSLPNVWIMPAGVSTVILNRDLFFDFLFSLSFSLYFEPQFNGDYWRGVHQIYINH